VLSTTPLSVADDGQRAAGKQAAQITITSLADTAKLFLAAAPDDATSTPSRVSQRGVNHASHQTIGWQ
jgi:hypothetical protein